MLSEVLALNDSEVDVFSTAELVKFGLDSSVERDRALVSS